MLGFVVLVVVMGMRVNRYFIRDPHYLFQNTVTAQPK